MTTVLAIGLGGSGLKAGRVSASAQLTATERVDRPIPLGPEGRSEVNPEVWWDDLGHATMRLAAASAEAYASVAADAICGMARTQVVVDEAGTALRPAVTWRDASAPPIPLDDRVLDPFHPIACLNRLKRDEPKVATRTAAVLEPKDYLATRLTGVVASDPVSVARLVEDSAYLAFSTILLLFPTGMAGWCEWRSAAARAKTNLSGKIGRSTTTFREVRVWTTKWPQSTQLTRKS